MSAARRIEPAPAGKWTLVIPGFTPTRDNQLIYVHWATARRLKRHDANVIARAAVAYGVPKATGRRRVTLTVQSRFRRLPDDTAYLKSALDGLVHAGLLVDDSREWMDLTWPPEYLKGPKQTTIELENL